MFAVIDYKAGNLTSVMKALAVLGAEASSTANPEVVRRASKVILPGVGHFQATRLLEETGLTAAVRDVIDIGVPFLGICVGLQWLFAGSTEAPSVSGLGRFPGECEHFPAGVKAPHVGWNSLALTGPASAGDGAHASNQHESMARSSKLMRGIADGAFVYYTHSFRPPVVTSTVAVTEYGGRFSAAVERGNVMGVQFHPEKSGDTGLRMLKNFLEWGC
jgi:imidazole glycerol-phosphate synthase subunit HisH